MTPAPEGPLRVVSADTLVTTTAAPESPAPAPSLGDGPITVALSHPIMAHGERLTALTFRPPMIEEMETVNVIGTLDTKKFSALIVLLGGIPRSSVLQLAPRDFLRCANEIAKAFFLPQDPTS